jgi:hypothetical protein
VSGQTPSSSVYLPFGGENWHSNKKKEEKIQMARLEWECRGAGTSSSGLGEKGASRDDIIAVRVLVGNSALLNLDHLTPVGEKAVKAAEIIEQEGTYLRFHCGDHVLGASCGLLQNGG